MDRPTRDGSSPDCWREDVKQYEMHVLAGIGDHFFYLLSEGSGKKTINGIPYNSPTCNGKQVKGIGNATAAKIWYRAVTVHLTSDSNYSDARTATLKSAEELFGARSKQARAVRAAWQAVNVPGENAEQGLFTQQPSKKVSRAADKP
jgi:Zn-dependent metalloprotease